MITKRIIKCKTSENKSFFDREDDAVLSYSSEFNLLQKYEMGTVVFVITKKIKLERWLFSKECAIMGKNAGICQGGGKWRWI